VSYGRRKFILGTTAVAAAMVSTGTFGRAITAGLAAQGGATGAPFEMLVLGDSVVWGQGLQEGQKFYTLVRDALVSELLRRGDIRMLVRAHSGGTILPQHDFTPRNYGEVPTARPSLYEQAAMASDLYDYLKVPPENVNLVLLNGGINDFGVPALVNPLTREDRLREQAHSIFRVEMKNLLQRLLGKFPNALFVVTGYYPMITAGTPENTLSELIRAFLGQKREAEIERLARREDMLVRTDSGRGWLFTRLLSISAAWKASSDTYLSEAVNEINGMHGTSPPGTVAGCKRVLFAKVELGDEEGYGAADTALWKITREFKTDDPRYTDRRGPRFEPPNPQPLPGFCEEELNRLTLINRQICRLAATGHPNLKGVKIYTDAILKELRGCLRPA
jgi:lysophospholipase L1-like esterase